MRASALQLRALELRNSKRPGAFKVLAALASQHPELHVARNEWEAAVCRLAREAGLPEPVPNFAVVVDGQRRLLAVAWPEFMVDLEFDGFGPHMVRAVFDDDRVRQNALVAACWTVFRVTSRMLNDDPRSVFDAISAHIAFRRHENRHGRRIA